MKNASKIIVFVLRIGHVYLYNVEHILGKNYFQVYLVFVSNVLKSHASDGDFEKPTRILLISAHKKTRTFSLYIA